MNKRRINDLLRRLRRSQLAPCLVCGTLFQRPRQGRKGPPIETITRWDTSIRTVKVAGVVVHQCRAAHRDPATGMPIPDPATGKVTFHPVEASEPGR